MQTARSRPAISVDVNLENSFLDQKCENLTSRNAEFAEMQKLHKRQNTADPLSVIEMVTNGMYNQFNLSRPKFGCKGYNFPNQLLADNNYKIKSAPKDVTNRDKYHFITIAAKKHAFVPAAGDMPGLHAWGTDKYFKHSADNMKWVLTKTPKTSMTEDVQT
jgi:hypothetical protein